MVWGSDKTHLACIIAVFIAGVLLGYAWADIGSNALEKPLSLGIPDDNLADLSSPSDHIPEENIHVFSDRIVIDVEDASWAKFTDTNSMDPFIDAGANSIEIKPESADDVDVGDVISFRTEFADGLIIHRIVEIGEDGEGAYFITQGDNAPGADPGKRRFEDIEGVVVGVVY
jgi:hypothetical protein